MKTRQSKVMSSCGLIGNFNKGSSTVAEVVRLVSTGGGQEHAMSVGTLDTRLATVQGRGTMLQDSTSRLIGFSYRSVPPAQCSRCSLFSSGPHTRRHRISFRQLGIIRIVLQHFWLVRDVSLISLPSSDSEISFSRGLHFLLLLVCLDSLLSSCLGSLQ